MRPPAGRHRRIARSRWLAAAGLALTTLAAACGSGTDEAAESVSTDPTWTVVGTPDPGGAADTGRTAPGPPPDALAGRVIEVVDGDTVRIAFEEATESVRLIGIDTPEPSGGFQPKECFGDEASTFTRQLLPPDAAVLVTFDEELRDRFDRVLGYVYRADDGLFVNLSIIENGFAGQMAIEPNTTFSGLFSAATDAAAGTDLGLWGACAGPDDLVDS